MTPPPLYGLVLSGGFSTRMGRDKGSIIYHGVDQRSHCHALLEHFCQEVFISVRKEQAHLLPGNLTPLFDLLSDIGPAAGLLAAYEKIPLAAWLVLACDMPYVTTGSVETLVKNRDPHSAGTAYISERQEPFFAIWEPRALENLKTNTLAGLSSPMKTLAELDCAWVDGDSRILENVNAGFVRK